MSERAMTHRHKAILRIFGETLALNWDGNVWVTSSGAQYGRLEDAARDECEALIRASGDDPAEFEREIREAIRQAE